MNSFVTKNKEETITISVQQYSGKKLQLDFMGGCFFWGGTGGGRYLINRGSPNKKGRGQTKIKKINKGGCLIGTGKNLWAKPWHGIFCIYV